MRNVHAFILMVAALAPLPALAQDGMPASPAPAPPVEERPPAEATPPAADPAAPATTVAQTAPEPRRLSPLLLGARFGVVIPQVFNPLDANFLVELEAAYQLPFIGRRLGIFLDVGYSRPTISGTRADPRLNNPACSGPCAENFDVVIHDVGFTLGLHYWHPITDRWLVFGGLGAKLHLTRTITNASLANAGMMEIPLGENTEDSTRFGLDVRLGGGFRVGPGAIVLEAHLEYTPIDHLITGGERAGESTNTAHLSLLAGYTFFLL